MQAAILTRIELHRSIELKCVAIVYLERAILVLLLQITIADGEHIKICTHKATEGVFRCADDRFTAWAAMLKLVLTNTGQPVRALKAEMSA